MRLYAFLILIAVLMAFSAGYLSLLVRNASNQNSNYGTIGEVRLLQAKFQKQERPDGHQVLQALFPIGGDFRELIDPSSTLPLNHRYPFATLSALFRYADTCRVGQSERIQDQDPILKKSWQWLRFKCGESAKLPADFFEKFPFTFALGGSYAYFATQNAAKLGVNQEWIQNHLQYFHISELKNLDPAIDVGPARRALSQLDLDSLAAIQSESEVILSRDFIFLRDSSDYNKPSGNFGQNRPTSAYFFYPRKQWDKFLSKTSYRAESISEGQLCGLREGNVCWRFETIEAFRSIEKPAVIMLLASLGFALTCVWIAIRKFSEQRSDQEKKRFALQTLTHELRTPLSSLIVSSEEILDHFDSLPQAMQTPILRMCDDVQRLQRLAEVSKSYLSSESGGALIRLKYAKIDSVNTYLKSLLEAYEKQIEIEFLAEDKSFSADSYWFAICIKNIVENAFQHGSPPIKVKAKMRGSELELQIEDGGRSVSHRIEEMTQSFSKGNSSQGLGLGLSIVKNVLDTMGAHLSFSANPTCFTIRIQEKS